MTQSFLCFWPELHSHISPVLPYLLGLCQKAEKHFSQRRELLRRNRTVLDSYISTSPPPRLGVDVPPWQCSIRLQHPGPRAGPVLVPCPRHYVMPVDGICSGCFSEPLEGSVQLVAGTAQGFCDLWLIGSCCSILCNPKTASGKSCEHPVSCFTNSMG